MWKLKYEGPLIGLSFRGEIALGIGLGNVP